MAKMTVKGLDVYNAQLKKLAAQAEKINRGALGEGAGYVADEIKSALDSMPLRPDSTHPHKLYGATESEKEQIIDNFGIARFRTSGGGINTSVGFHGYVDTPSERFGDRVPTGMLVQCINYGTAFRVGTHTVDKAISAVKKSVSEKMQNYIDKETEKIMK